MKYLNYDTTTGQIKGFYDPEINGPNIPTPNIQISDAQWQTCLSGRYQVDLSTQAIVASPAPPPPSPDPATELETYFLQQFLANTSQLSDTQIGGIFQAKAAIDSIFQLLQSGSIDEATCKIAILGAIKTPSLPSTLEAVRTDILNYAEGLL